MVGSSLVLRATSTACIASTCNHISVLGHLLVGKSSLSLLAPASTVSLVGTFVGVAVSAFVQVISISGVYRSGAAVYSNATGVSYLDATSVTDSLVSVVVYNNPFTSAPRLTNSTLAIGSAGCVSCGDITVVGTSIVASRVLLSTLGSFTRISDFSSSGSSSITGDVKGYTIAGTIAGTTISLTSSAAATVAATVHQGALLSLRFRDSIPVLSAGTFIDSTVQLALLACTVMSCRTIAVTGAQFTGCTVTVHAPATNVTVGGLKARTTVSVTSSNATMVIGDMSSSLELVVTNTAVVDVGASVRLSASTLRLTATASIAVRSGATVSASSMTLDAPLVELRADGRLSASTISLSGATTTRATIYGTCGPTATVVGATLSVQFVPATPAASTSITRSTVAVTLTRWAPWLVCDTENASSARCSALLADSNVTLQYAEDMSSAFIPIVTLIGSTLAIASMPNVRTVNAQVAAITFVSVTALGGSASTLSVTRKSSAAAVTVSLPLSAAGLSLHLRNTDGGVGGSISGIVSSSTFRVDSSSSSEALASAATLYVFGLQFTTTSFVIGLPLHRASVVVLSSLGASSTVRLTSGGAVALQGAFNGAVVDVASLAATVNTSGSFVSTSVTVRGAVASALSASLSGTWVRSSVWLVERHNPSSSTSPFSAARLRVTANFTSGSHLSIRGVLRKVHQEANTIAEVLAGGGTYVATVESRFHVDTQEARYVAVYLPLVAMQPGVVSRDSTITVADSELEIALSSMATPINAPYSQPSVVVFTAFLHDLGPDVDWTAVSFYNVTARLGGAPPPGSSRVALAGIVLAPPNRSQLPTIHRAIANVSITVRAAAVRVAGIEVLLSSVLNVSVTLAHFNVTGSVDHSEVLHDSSQLCSGILLRSVSMTSTTVPSARVISLRVIVHNASVSLTLVLSPRAANNRQASIVSGVAWVDTGASTSFLLLANTTVTVDSRFAPDSGGLASVSELPRSRVSALLIVNAPFLVNVSLRVEHCELMALTHLTGCGMPTAAVTVHRTNSTSSIAPSTPPSTVLHVLASTLAACNASTLPLFSDVSKASAAMNWSAEVVVLDVSYCAGVATFRVEASLLSGAPTAVRITRSSLVQVQLIGTTLQQGATSWTSGLSGYRRCLLRFDDVTFLVPRVRDEDIADVRSNVSSVLLWQTRLEPQPLGAGLCVVGSSGVGGIPSTAQGVLPAHAASVNMTLYRVDVCGGPECRSRHKFAKIMSAT